MKTLPKRYNARVNSCSLKKKIGEPAGTNISTIIVSLIKLGLVRLVYLFMPHIVIFTPIFYRALALNALLYYWNAVFC